MDWQNFMKKSHSGVVMSWWSFLPLVSYTFFSLIKPSKESGTYRELNKFVRSLMSFALGGNETLAPSSLLHAQGAEAGHLLGVIRRLRTKHATFQKPWPSSGMANRDSTLPCRPLEVGHFLAIIQRSSSRTRIATCQTTIAFPSSGETHFTLLRPSSISWALVGGHSTIEASECHLSISHRLHQQRRTTLYPFDIILHRPIPAHHYRSYDQRRPLT